MKYPNTKQGMEYLSQCRAAYIKAEQASGLKKGDTVRVVGRADDNALGWQNAWTSDMSAMVGKNAVVLSIGSGGVGVSLQCGLVSQGFPFFVLEKVVPEVVVKLNEDYSATITANEVKVGCQTFPWSKIEEMIAARKSLLATA